MEMCAGRQAYINSHLHGQKDYALVEQVSKLSNTPDRKQNIFINASIVDDQLQKLLTQLGELEETCWYYTVEGREQQQRILHVEQVIGRVARILNRPETPTQHQKALYLDNLQETLKLAAELSIYDETSTLREIGRLLMWIAAAAAMTAIVSYFVFSSAPIAITAAVCSTLLGGLGLYLQKFSSEDSLKEALSDVVYNVKPFPSNWGDVFSGCCGVWGDWSGGEDDKNNSGPSINQFDRYIDTDKIQSYLKSKITEESHNSYYYDDNHLSTELTDKIKTGLSLRVASGDSVEELNDQLSGDFDCEKLAAISGVAIIPMHGTVMFVSMEKLIAEGALDPLGAENPEEALQTAFQKYAMKAEERHTSFMTTITNAANKVYSFFGMNRNEASEERVNTEVEVVEPMLMQYN